MKKSQWMATVLLSALGVGASVAEAQYLYYPPRNVGPYFYADIGPSFFEPGQITSFGGPVSGRVDYDPGVAADMAIGWNFNRYVGADFELGYVGAQVDNVSGFFSDNTWISNMPFLANVVFSLPIPGTIVVPYIGGGAGGADIGLDTDGLSDGTTVVVGREDDVEFAWQAFAGLRFKLNNRLFLGIGYKYFATQDSSFSYPPAPNFPVSFRGVRTHSVLFTFLYKF